MEAFQIAGGSVPGSDHTKPGQPGWTNNHDAYAWRRSKQCLVAVVSDGCGSGAHSEVGAHLFAQLITNSLLAHAERYLKVASLQLKTEHHFSYWDRVEREVLAHITTLASSMGESFSRTIKDYFLCTIVGALIMPRSTFVFSLGDGLMIVNNEVNILGPFPNDAPPYLAYNLLNEGNSQQELHISVNRVLPTSELQSLLIGSDGAVDFMGLAQESIAGKEEVIGPIEQFFCEDRFFTNSDAIRRRLALVNRERSGLKGSRFSSGPLRDDTTILTIRRMPDSIDGGEGV